VFSVNVFILLLPLICRIKVNGLGDFGNAIFLIFMIIGGAMVIPAGQGLFTRLFGQPDDMHAGGGFLHSVFYGGRIVGAMTFGVAGKIIKGIAGIRKKKKNDDDDDDDKDTRSDSGGEESDKYTEEKSETAE